MPKERNLYLDVLKAISIILVVIGHAIQYGSGLEYLSMGYCLYNKLFIFIYSFHMPLFMLISGFLFSFSLKNKTAKELLFSKFKQLIVPLFCWSFITTIVQVVKTLAGVATHEISFVWIFQTILSSFWGGPWFLWALWWCSFVIIIGRKFLKDNAIFYVLICAASFVTPNVGNMALYKFMFPFFLLAYLFNQYDLKSKFAKIYGSKIFIVACPIIFIVLLKFYNFDSYIYTTGYTLLNKNVIYQLHNDLFRFVIGLFGSITVCYAVRLLVKISPQIINKSLAYVGSCTFGIYIISNYIFDDFLKYLPINGLNCWYTLIEIVAVLAFTIGVSTLLKRIKITNKLLLGGR